MLNIVLVEPEIPQNCGNIARTCAATGCRLHLVGPFGFDTSDAAVQKNMKRCGLDYWHLVEVLQYENLDDFYAKNQVGRQWFLSTKAPQTYTQAQFAQDDYLFFGKETAGLPEDLLNEHYQECLRVPMCSVARSLNLSNAVAIVTYEAMRQLDFENLLETGKMGQK